MLSATLSTIFVAFYNGAARHSVAIDKLSVAAVVRGAVEGKEDIMVAWAQMTALARRCRTAVLVLGCVYEMTRHRGCGRQTRPSAARGLHSGSGMSWLLAMCNIFTMPYPLVLRQ